MSLEVIRGDQAVVSDLPIISRDFFDLTAQTDENITHQQAVGAQLHLQCILKQLILATLARGCISVGACSTLSP